MNFQPKQFENLYTAKINNRYVPERISFSGMSHDEYVNTFRDSVNKFYNEIFDYCVKLRWLKNNFQYDSKKTKSGVRNGRNDYVFSHFTRNVIGKDLKILNNSFFYSKVGSYIEELFPHFNLGNPFTNPEDYKFPYKNISIDFMTVVYQMPRRLEYLKEADDKNMTYAQFLDFILNEIFSENEKLGRDRYDFRGHDCFRLPPYVRDIDNNAVRKKNKITTPIQ